MSRSNRRAKKLLGNQCKQRHEQSRKSKYSGQERASLDIHG
jgi:hypothetical protein